MFPAASRYLALVERGCNAWWRHVLGILLVVFFFQILGYVPYRLIEAYTDFDTMIQFVALNLSVMVGLAGVYIATVGVQRRSMLSLITPYARFDWRRVLHGAAVWAGLAAVFCVIEAALYPGRYRLTFNPDVFFIYAVLALLLTPLQTATEELLFRGYLMQSLSLLFKRPWVLIIISSALFTLPHAANPEVALAPLLVLPQYFIIGALLAIVTLKDGRLELAIGIHAANNLFTGLIANIEPSVISTEAIFTSQFDPAFALVALVLSSIASYFVLFWPRHNSLSAAELAQFENDGYVVVRGLADPVDCAIMLAKAKRDHGVAVQPLEYEADTGYPGAPASLDAPGGRTVRRLLQTYARSEVFARWLIASKLAARLHQLLGPCVEMSQAHHNCVMTKNPSFSSITHWHQDIRYWSFDKPALISVWTALVRERPENGCLSVLPGSHHVEFLPEQFDGEMFLRPEHPANHALIATQRAVTLDPGDVLFFHCRLLHAASDNRSTETKFSLVSTYHAADNRPLAGTRSASLPDVPL